MITRLRARNFKSFDTLDVELGQLNVFVGGNASGKSNLLSLLTFMRDLMSFGLEDAVSLQGGASFFQNLQCGKETSTQISLLNTIPDEGEHNFTYYQIVMSSKSGSGQILIEDEVLIQGQGEVTILNPDIILEEHFVRFHVKRDSGKVLSYRLNNGELVQDQSRIYGPRDVTPKHAFISILLHAIPILSYLNSGAYSNSFLPVFDFDLHRLKQEPQSLRARSQLAEDGGNVALVLRDVLKDEAKRRKFLNLLGALLPFAKDLSVDRYTEESLVFQLEETYSDTPLPPSLLSDGTIQAVALILAMYFDERPVITFEEPARSLHPKLVARLVQMMEDASRNKQILLTTHNPEFLRHVDLNDVHFVSRDEDGFSQVTRPKDSEMVRSFLGEDLGLNDLFVDDLLNV